MKVVIGEAARDKLCGKNIGRGHRILDCEVDPHSSNWRHRVRGITNTEKAWTRPLPQAIHFHREQAHVLPITQFADPVAQGRFQAGNIFAKLRDPTLANFIHGALGTMNAHCQ